MNLSKYQHFVLSLASGGLLLIGLFLLLNGTSQVARADPGNMFVSPSGSGDCSQDTPCDPQTALGLATDGDTIYMAAGTYTGTGGAVVTVTKSITLYGGWDGTTTTPPVRDPDAHPTTLDGEGARRVVYINGNISPTIDGFIITGGDAAGLGGTPWGDDAGGGVYIITATATINNNRVFRNTADDGGGLYLWSSTATLSGNTVISNTANSQGGGLYLNWSDAILSGNTVISNTATTGSGGGLYLNWSDAILSGNTVISNTATTGSGGGLFLYGSDATLSGNTVISNAASGNGGGLALYAFSDATLSGNTVTDNTARRGGGLYLNRSDATLTNSVVADNQANVNGSGLYIVRSSSPRLLHTTMARNSGTSGVYVTNSGSSYSTVALTNTILVSHSVGITVTAGNTATLESTLWHSNTTADWGGAGTINRSNDYTGDPRFDADGYHLMDGSAAIDKGVDAGVTTDIDGDPRPVGAGYDIGADEFRPYRIYLPLTLKSVGG